MSNSLQTRRLHVAHQAPLFMGFSRQEYWSGQPFPSPGDIPDLRIEPGSPALQADSLPFEPLGKPWSFYQQQNFSKIERLHGQEWDPHVILLLVYLQHTETLWGTL